LRLKDIGAGSVHRVVADEGSELRTEMLDHLPEKFEPAGLQLLAREIRAARLQLGWTLDELSVAAGLNKGYLSKVERGLKAPSLGTVLNLARVLKVPVGRLFGEAVDDTAIQVSRADRRQIRDADPDGGYRLEALTAGGGGIEGFIMIPRLDFTSDFRTEHDGEEILYVLNGTVEVRFVDRIVTLNQADAIRFPGRLQHQVRRTSQSASVLIAVSRS
jgi:transcriptional regulator with XRE-family HTH domain